MSDARTDHADERAHHAAAQATASGKHRGPASPEMEDGVPTHGRHRRHEHQD